MIPYLLAAIGGYLIGESQKKETEKSEAPQMADGGQLPRYYSVRFNNNYGTTAWGHTESEAINNARKSLKLGDDFKVKNIVEIKFRNGVPVSEWAKELQAKGRMMAKGGMLMHGFDKGDTILEIYKGYGIVENNNNGVIEVLNPNKGSRFVIDLDDSKSSGMRKSMGLSKEQQIKSAIKYIDWLDEPLPDTFLEKYGKDKKGSKMEDGGMMGYGGKINFMREEYPFKTINGYIFAKYDLYDKLMDSDGKYVSKEAEEIDNRITFYLQDEEWDKSDDEIIEIWKKYSR